MFYFGNEKLMNKKHIEFDKCDKPGTTIYISINEKYAGYILISDKMKKDSKEAISGLKKNGVKEIVMLTGDRKDIANKVSKDLGIDKVYSELLPDGKVEKVEELLKQKRDKGKLIFVGDRYK